MSSTKVSLRWLLRRIRKNIPSILCLTLFSIGSSLCGVFFALGTKGVIDAAISQQKNLFMQACITQACIIICMLLCTTIDRHLTEHIRANLDRDWKKSLLNDLLNSEYKAVSQFHSSELLNRMNNDVNTLNDAVINLLPNICAMITKLIAAFCVLTAFTPWFTLFLVVAGIVVIIITGVLRKQLKGLHKRVSEANGLVSGILQETMEKLLAVQAMDITNEIERRVKHRLDDRFEIIRKRKNISLFSRTCISIMFYGSGFAALIWCASGLLTGAMTFGTMTAITQLVNQIQAPITRMSNVIPQYIAATAAAERLYELDALPRTVLPASESPHSLYNRLDSITADNVTFTYDRDRILDNASFTMPKGLFGVITGPSGAGKSTLLKLMLGIFNPEHGELYLQCGDERIPINGSTRRLFAYVPQGNLLFSGTIRENLLVVNPNATEDEINNAIYVSAMDSYLHQLPNGLDTVLGESGAGLSEGQAQRLAIARAVLCGAPILLLDECTSALDVKTEELVLQRLCQQKDKTYLAVTHRPVAEQICDLAIRIDNQKVTLEYR